MKFANCRRAIFAAGTTALIVVLWLAPRRTEMQPRTSPAGEAAGAPRPAVLPVVTGAVQAPPADAASPVQQGDREPVQAEPLARFRAWIQRWNTEAHGAALLQEGQKLARARTEHLLELARTRPAQVLKEAMPFRVRYTLPAEVLALVEDRVDAVGRVSVTMSTPRPGGPVNAGPFHKVLIGTRQYDAIATGPRRSGNVPEASLHGVALGRTLVLSDSPVRLVEAGERVGFDRPLKNQCLVSGKITPGDGAFTTAIDAPPADLIDTGRHFVRVCTAAHVAKAEHLLAQREAASQPWIPVAAKGSEGTDGFVPISQPDIAWTTGAKKLLFILVDFADKPGRPFNDATSQSMTETNVVNLINGSSGVKAFYEQNSFGKTSVSVAPLSGSDSPDVTNVLRMPKSAAYYAQNDANDELHSDAEAAAVTAGYTLADYDCITVFFSDLSNISGSFITYGGLGEIVGKNNWINGYGNMAVIAHELGHNYGLQHASRVRTSGSVATGTGSWEEYGDTLDVMGDGTGLAHHFNMWSKMRLHWLGGNGAQLITGPGTYRVARFDHQSANPDDAALPLALRLANRTDNEWWLGYRRAITSNTYTNNGMYAVWATSGSENTQLIDFNGPNDTDAANSPLQVGATFTDPETGISFKPVAKGGASPAEYLDIQIGMNSRVVINDASSYADEGAGVHPVFVERTRPGGAVSMNWTTTQSTAKTGLDFTAASGTLNWAAGEMGAKVIGIPIVRDDVSDKGEYFVVNFTSVTGAAMMSADKALRVYINEPGETDLSFRNDANSWTEAAWIDNNVTTVVPDGEGGAFIAGAFSSVGPTARDGLARLSPTGYLDATFAPPSGSAGVLSIALQPDGKVLVGGSFTDLGGTASRIARLNADGSLDSTFNPGTGPSAPVTCIVVQPDGQILVAGSFTSFNGVSRKHIVRLNSNGSIDGSFTNPALTTLGGGSIDSIALQSDGAMFVGGLFRGASVSPFRQSVAHLSSTGVVDSAFDIGHGCQAGASTSVAGRVRSVAALPGGKVAVGGSFGGFNGSTARSKLLVLNDDGTIDGSRYPFVPDNDVSSLAAASDGSLLIGGYFFLFNSIPAKNIARLMADGTIDLTFSGNANAVTRSSVFDVAISPWNHRLFVAGWGASGPDNDSPVYSMFCGAPAVAPTITLQPLGANLIENQSHTFTVATDALHATVQWFRDGVAVPDANGLSLVIDPAQPSDAGTYTAVIASGGGTVTSNGALLSVSALPVITAQPLPVSVVQGSPATFTVGATGVGLTYQWQNGTTDIPGETGPDYTIPSAMPADAGNYRCAVTNIVGTKYSNPASLTVIVPPTINTQPLDVLANAGSAASFTVDAAGGGLSYQWQKDGLPVLGATGATLAFASISPTDEGDYVCAITNAAGAIATLPATLTIVTAPVLLSPPVSVTSGIGQSVSFSVAAAGAALQFQWQHDQSDIGGANASTYLISPVGAGDAGRYRCVITNTAGSVTSSEAALTLIAAPVIDADPAPMTVNAGQSAEFTIAATGQQLSYQWQKNMVPIAGANTGRLIIPLAGGGDADNYRCIVSNAAGSATSNAAALTVITIPVITAQPASLSVNAGNSAAFTVSATGPNLAFAWQRNGLPISGANAATLNIASVQAGDAGSYVCTVSNSAGSAISSAASLSVNGAPQIVRQPESALAEAGAAVSFSVLVAGTGPFTYDWKKNGTSVGSNATLPIASMSAASAGSYQCTISDGTNTVTTNAVTLALASGFGQALDDSVRKWSTQGQMFWSKLTGAEAHDAVDAMTITGLGANERSALGATITGPVTLRWWERGELNSSDTLAVLMDGVAISSWGGSVAWRQSSLIVPAGVHRIDFMCARGPSAGTGSEQVWLDGVTAGTPFTIESQPVSRLVNSGTNVSFAVGTSGLPTTYQWRRNGVKITGATAPVLLLNDVSNASGGDYSCLVGGTTTSVTAKLIVITAGSVQRTKLGGTATLKITPSSASGLAYAWHAHGGPLTSGPSLTGTLTSSLTVKNVTPSDETDYECHVSSTALGLSVTSLPVALDVVSTPVIDATAPLAPAVGMVSRPYSWQITASEYPTTYSLSPVPSGLKFTAATGTLSGTPNVAGDFTLTIKATNAAGTATVTMPLKILPLPAASVGSFSALVGRGTLTGGLGGTAAFTVASNGTVTGSVKLGAVTAPLTGRVLGAIGGAPTFNTIVQPKGLGAQPLAVIFVPGSESFTGVFGDGTTIAGSRHVWTTQRTAVHYAGRFNALHRVPGLASIPKGVGFTQLVVGTNGSTTFSGKLPDGLALSGSATIWPDGSVLTHSLLYSNHGSLTGTQRVALDGSVTGALSWNKGGPVISGDKLYAGGFALMNLATTGHKWITAAPVPGLASARTTFADGGIESTAQFASLDQVCTIDARNVAVFPPAATNPVRLALIINGTTGLFTGTGTLTDPHPVTSLPTTRPLSFSGVFDSTTKTGDGVFQLSALPTLPAATLSGNVHIAAP